MCFVFILWGYLGGGRGKGMHRVANMGASKINFLFFNINISLTTEGLSFCFQINKCKNYKSRYVKSFANYQISLQVALGIAR